MKLAVSRLKKSLYSSLYFFLVLITLQTASAQEHPPLPDHLSENARVSLLSIYPGTELYAAFGHSAIRIVDAEAELDRVYNYGTFSFEEPGFYLKFARGLLDYMLSAYSYQFLIYIYTDERRPIIEQVLNLTPAMKDKIYRFLEWNYLPQNRRYRYDFFFDNCATRIRDVFEKNLDGNLHLYLNSERKLTFRQYIDLYLGHHPISHFGMDLGLGDRSDRIATPWEAMFLPDFLFESFAKATITIDGETEPFVVKMDTLLWFEGADKPSYTLPWADIIFWGLFALIAALTFWSYRSKNFLPRLNRWVDVILFGLIGLVGLLILFLWFGTDHKVTPDNWNLMWTWPTHIIIIVFLFFKNKPKWLFAYFALYTFTLLVFLAGWRFWPQGFNSANFPLVLTLALRSGWRAYQLKSADRQKKPLEQLKKSPAKEAHENR